MNLKGQNFNLWPFWCPLRKKFIQYLIWKLSLVVRNHKVGKGVAALLHSTIQSWKGLILLHTESNKRFWGSTAVYSRVWRISMVAKQSFWKNCGCSDTWKDFCICKSWKDFLIPCTLKILFQKVYCLYLVYCSEIFPDDSIKRTVRYEFEMIVLFDL